MLLLDHIGNAIGRAAGKLAGLRKRLLPKPAPSAGQWDGMVAEAAYYRAGERGFASGGELGDWLEAEKEILARLAAN